MAVAGCSGLAPACAARAVRVPARQYHHWEHQHVGEERSVRFRITKHGGDGMVMVRHGASFDEAPLKLAPPYLRLEPETDHAFVEYCRAKDAVCRLPARRTPRRRPLASARALPHASRVVVAAQIPTTTCT